MHGCAWSMPNSTRVLGCSRFFVVPSLSCADPMGGGAVDGGFNGAVNGGHKGGFIQWGDLGRYLFLILSASLESAHVALTWQSKFTFRPRALRPFSAPHDTRGVPR